MKDNNLLLQHFEAMGLSPNTAKVYLALLEYHPVTGYQLSQKSGLIKPVVYDTLPLLVEKGGAKVILQGKTSQYIPVPIADFIQTLDNHFAKSREALISSLQERHAESDQHGFITMQGADVFIATAQQAMARAQYEIVFACPSQEWLNPFLDILQDKLKQGVRFDGFSFAQLESQDVPFYSYRLTEHQARSLCPASCSLCIDEQMLLLSSLSSEVLTLQTNNPAVVYEARQKIKQDVYILRMWRSLGANKLKLFLDNEDKLKLQKIENWL